MRVSGQVVSRNTLTHAQRRQMFELMVEHYANVDRAEFEADLDEKKWVVVATEPETDRIVGFSTQTMLDVTFCGQTFRALFSGDTIVHRAYWGRNPLAKTWGRFALSLIDDHTDASLFWFLITKGYRTYRFLPLFFNEFYPRYDRHTTAQARRAIDALGKLKFPKSYDARSGIVKASDQGPCLRPGVAAVNEARLRDPNVRFFDIRNPGHLRGDELCCIAPLTRRNFTRAAYRVMGINVAAASLT